MKRFFSYFRGYVAESILAPLFKMLEAINELIVPIIVAMIIDKGIANNDKSYILKYCGVLAVLGVVGLGFALTAQYFSAKSATGYAKSVRTALMEKVQNLSYSDLDKLGSSKIINTMTEDVTVIQQGINLILRLALRSPFIVFGAFIFAMTVDVKGSIPFMVLLPILLVVVYYVMYSGVTRFKGARQKADKVMLSARESIYGVREIRSFSLEESKFRQFNDRNEELREANTNASNFVSFLNPLTYTLVNLTVILLIYYGAIRVESGALTKGGVIALYNYMSQILIELVKMANLTISISKMLASWDRVSKLLKIDVNRQVLEQENTEKTAYISIKDVKFSYNKDGKNVLDGINLDINQGEKVGIIGGTGSGKSTLVSLLYKGYDIDSGSIVINGKDISCYTENEIRNTIALVPQKSVLFKGTLRENLLWGNENATDEQLINAIKLAKGEEILKKGSLDMEVQEGGKNFSGGQRQRLAIARAIVKRAPIMIFDDSFSALDFATEKALISNIGKLSCTAIIISQRISGLKGVSKILVLENGEQQGLGNVETLLCESEVFKEIYNAQVKEEEV